MKLPGNIKLNSIADFAKKNLSVALLAFLVLVLITVYFIVYAEWRKISDSSGDSKNPGQIVRVNLDSHKELEKKLNENVTFTPSTVNGADAFGLPPSLEE